MIPPFVACMVLVAMLSYLGLHVIAREVIFVDLSLAQMAALGGLSALLIHVEADSTWAYVFALFATAVGALLFALTRSSTAHGARSVSGAPAAPVSASTTVATATPERASASACRAASDFSARRSSSTVVSARPSASTLISASAVTAATSTTPRSRRRDTDHLHQLAGGPARLRVDAHPHLAQRRMQRAADVALEAEAARTHALAVARLRRPHLRLGEERLCEQHGARRLPVRRDGGHAAREQTLERAHADGEDDERHQHLQEREAAAPRHGAPSKRGASIVPVTARRRVSAPSADGGRPAIRSRRPGGVSGPGATVRWTSSALRPTGLASRTEPAPFASAPAPCAVMASRASRPPASVHHTVASIGIASAPTRKRAALGHVMRRTPSVPSPAAPFSVAAPPVVPSSRSPPTLSVGMRARSRSCHSRSVASRPRSAANVPPYAAPVARQGRPVRSWRKPGSDGCASSQSAAASR